MTRTISFFIFLCLTIAFCQDHRETLNKHPVVISQAPAKYKTIGEMPAPAGYERIPAARNSFGEWLRQARLREDSRVYLYNGALKGNQWAQFAVLDIPVGNRDLQQCADAIMRLRAEYFFSRNDTAAIQFKATDGTELSFARWLRGERYKISGTKLLPYMSTASLHDKRNQLEQFLEVVFMYCGTISLDHETRAVYDLNDMQIGDVFVKAGSPGHAMTVVDIVMNQNGEKMFMLAQSAMPAQDLHIVKNPINGKGGPWYKIGDETKIITPEWVFSRNQLKRW